MPDIDSDFCFERRDEVVDYVRQKYGEERVAQIITFGTIKGKQAIRDVGRVLGLSFGETDKIVKLYPAPKQGRDFPLSEALEMEPRLKEERKTHPELFANAFKLEGLLRHASKHAAGVVISDVPLDETVPLYVDKEREEGGLAITQYSMKGVDEIGLIKFDFLALKNLTLIANTLDIIKTSGQEPPDLNRLSLDDPDAYRLLSRGDTVGVFQMESSGMRRFLTDLKPSCFEDVIAAFRCFAPAPLDAIEDGKTMVQHFVHRKHGSEKVEYDHPLLEPVLKRHLRRHRVPGTRDARGPGAGRILARSKRIFCAPRWARNNKAAMEREREHFIKGAVKNGVSKALASIDFFQKSKPSPRMDSPLARRRLRAHLLHGPPICSAHYPREFMAALIIARHGRSIKDLQKYRGAARNEDWRAAARCKSERRQVHRRRRSDPLRLGGNSRRRRENLRGDHRQSRAKKAPSKI